MILIPYTFSDNQKNISIINFLNHEKKFFFMEIIDFKNFKDKKIIFIKESTDHKTILYLVNYLKNDNVLFVLPYKFKDSSIFINLDKIYYPIKPSFLEKKYLYLKKIYFSYQDLLLGKNNQLININNKQEIYLTETESNIMKMLIENEAVKKNTIKKNILNLNIEIDTKSLDSHLSRIRKKIKKIGLLIEIVSIGSFEIKLR